MQSSLPAGWLAFTGRELNPLDRDEGFQITSSSLPGLFLAQRPKASRGGNRGGGRYGGGAGFDYRDLTVVAVIRHHNFCVISNGRPLYVANCSANEHILLSSEENGEPLASLGERARAVD